MNKTLKFAPQLIPLILSGEKTCTWRLWDDKDLKKGDIISLIKRPELEKFAKARITKAYEKTLGEITEEDRIGHEDVGTKIQMYKMYSGFYKKEVGPDTPVKIVRFELIE